VAFIALPLIWFVWAKYECKDFNKDNKMTDFARYTDASLTAFEFNPKSQDTIARKQEILDNIYRFHNFTPSSILFLGFNPVILSARAKRICVADISDRARAFLDSKGVKYEYIANENLSNYIKSFDAVVALEEYFTFADSDARQQELVKEISLLTKEMIISTLRDYKNQDFKDREFSQPAIVRNGPKNKLFLESHDWDMSDRNAWNTMVYEITNPDNSLETYGQFDRRTMYFKQFAKFTADAGAVGFTVHKNLMYKSLIKKNYEHVISVRFDNGY
jgi:hypothetical protein